MMVLGMTCTGAQMQTVELTGTKDALAGSELAQPFCKTSRIHTNAIWLFPRISVSPTEDSAVQKERTTGL